MNDYCVVCEGSDFDTPLCVEDVVKRNYLGWWQRTWCA
jgi:hypothetical protein